MVEIVNASLFYNNGTRGLDDVNLGIGKGELCFIVGRSGSGKSTLAKLLTGELKPTVGAVNVNSYNMGKISRKKKALARRTIGMVFQDYRLIPTMTVEENLEFAMRCVGAPGSRIEKRVEEVLELVELSDKGNSYPTELSGGEQQRVAIARAIINKPALLVADEPTGNLDAELAEDIMRLFVNINKLGTTAIIITHARDLVDKFPARVITLDAGKVVNDTAESKLLRTRREKDEIY